MPIEKGLLKRMIWRLPCFVRDTIWRLSGWQLQAQLDIDTKEVISLMWVPNKEVLKEEFELAEE